MENQTKLLLKKITNESADIFSLIGLILERMDLDDGVDRKYVDSISAVKTLAHKLNADLDLIS
ncbi:MULTISPECIES: hypothetical protein [Yersinia]|uniref:Histidine kinase n=1 Tax=Yersinia pekkanenii TaxID=1288385 RepID=A0A0T9RNT4_9GAMM|nr:MULTISPECIES: hypothetical protein [Yersinia]CNI74009.1 Uncharacterised protein [Yersinia pekkanenii]CRY69725.1 Uncharacterised protein [Yersinia pekkanenii]